MNHDRTIFSAFALGLTTLAFIVAKTGRDALFFQGSGGLLQLPVVYLNIGLASLPLALVFVKAMKTWGARPARIGILLFTGGVMALAAPFLQPGNNTPMLAMFMFIPASFGPLFASLWLLASDLFEKADRRDAARAFSKIGAATLAGGMAGGLISKILAPVLDPKWLILVAAVVIFAVVLLVLRVHRRFPNSVVAKQSGTGGGIALAVSNKYASTLLFISMSGALAGLLIDFQFYAAAAGARMGPQGNANFFANFYILLNLSSLLLQIFLTPRIQDRLGVSGGLMILPFALVGGAAFASAAATAFSRSVLRITEGGLRSSVHRSIWEQAFIPVNSSDRSTVKLAVDGIAARVAEAFGAVVILLWLKHFVPAGTDLPLDTRWMSWVILATVLAWLGITRRLRSQTAEQKTGIASEDKEVECERFPDQCPCTTELGKGIR